MIVSVFTEGKEQRSLPVAGNIQHLRLERVMIG